MKPIVVIPTYNEKENVRAMADAALANLPSGGEVLFVDDNSPDGTGGIVDGIAKENPRVHCLHRTKKEGLGRAYVAGFGKALELGADRVIEMDCDFSHPVERLKDLLAVDADVVIGSRYVKGGKCVGWPFKRWLISKCGGLFVRTVTGMPVADPTGGFKCFKRKVLEEIGLEKIESNGYSFQLEMNHRMWMAGYRIVEIPITFSERRAGYSKLSGSIAVESVKMVLKLWRSVGFRRSPRKRSLPILAILLATALGAQGGPESPVRVTGDVGRTLAGIRQRAERRLAEIRETDDRSVPKDAPVRYLSERGNDAADGRTPATAWRSVARLNREKLAPGSWVLFERGGLYRGEVTTCRGCTYAAWGKGPKPRIYGSPEDGAVASKWTRTEAENVWAYDIGPRDVGTLVFDGGAAHAIKIVIRKDAGTGKTYSKFTGRPFASYRDLEGDLHFWHDYYEKGTGKVYLFSRTNPGERFKSIEFNVKTCGFRATDGVTIENFDVRYAGIHGVAAGTVRNLRIANCTFEWIGGSIQAEAIFGRDYPTRLGNGIEVYGGCENFTVENCAFDQIYDAGVTHQVNIPEKAGMRRYDQRNVTYRDNLFRRCCYSIEYFLTAPNGNPSRMENVVFERNLSLDCGFGFSEQRPDTGVAAHVKAWRKNEFRNRATDYAIRDNVFCGSKDMVLQICSSLRNPDGSDSMPSMSGNLIVGGPSPLFGTISQTTAEVMPCGSDVQPLLDSRGPGNVFLMPPSDGGFKASAGKTVSEPPFVMMRMTRAPVAMPEKMRRVIAVNAAHPGSADAYWFAGGTYLKPEEAHAHFEKVAAFAPDCAKAGVRLDYQQGVTLGHGGVDGAARRLFTNDVWQVDASGKKRDMFCPRAPAVLAYEEAWIADLCRTAKPGAVWLDDDLRLGYCKADGCFCDRCLAAFNARYGHSFARAELADRLFGKSPRETVRREWLAFLADSLARFGAAARRGADKAKSDCMIAYQSVDASSFRSAGRDCSVLLRALSGAGAHPTAIRIGSGCYFESVRDLSLKMFSVARESERCRASDLNLAQICYEQENYTREILHKSAEAALVESALALACGCDSLSEYRWDGRRDEPLADYAEFAARLAAWRPYLKALGTLSRETTLGGVARFVGGDCDLLPDFTLDDPLDLTLADLGVPVSVAESPARLYYVTAKSLKELAEGDRARLFAPDASALVSRDVWQKLLAWGGAAATNAVAAGRLAPFDFASVATRGGTEPTSSERGALLDAFDRVGRLPVRIDRSHRFRVMPRMRRTDGKTLAVTLWNESAGAAPSTVVRVRNPAGAYPVWQRPEEPVRPLYVVSRDAGELVFVIPELPGRQVGTVFLTDALPHTDDEIVRVEGERAVLPPYDAKKWAWGRGYRLRAARMWETAADRAVVADSVKVVTADGRELKRGEDFLVEPRYGAVGLIGAAISNANPVTVSYDCRTERLDAWFVNAEGRIDCVCGEPRVSRPEPPRLPHGAKLLGHFWIRGGGRADDGRFFRNAEAFVPPHPPVPAETAMPKTLAKLRAGGKVRILAWGDSVTECAYLHPDERWQTRLATALRAKYPKATVELVTEAWGGRNTAAYLDQPPGAEHNFAEKVLGAKPDLVISEFVNDAGCDAKKVGDLYGKILAAFRSRGIEWVAFAPHYVIPDWMGQARIPEGTEDPRGYVKALKAFAVANGVGLADASARWGHLAREGLPYPILFVNGINHPDAFAMGFYVDAFLRFLVY